MALDAHFSLTRTKGIETKADIFTSPSPAGFTFSARSRGDRDS